MYKIVNIVMLAVTLISVSCRVELDVDIPQGERKLVLNAILQPDTQITAMVFISSHVQDIYQETNPVQGATLEVFENDNFLGNLESTNTKGVYTANIVPEIGKNYRIEARYNGYQLVYGTTLMVDSVPMSAFDSVGIGHDTYGWEMVLAKVTINDPANVKNYYKLSVISEVINEQDADTELYPIPLSSNDAIIDVAAYDAVYFTDDFFNGQSYAVKIQIDPYSLGYFDSGDAVYYPDDNNPEFHVYAKLESMSEAMYNYAKSVATYHNTGEFGLFSQPVIIYNNIENGLGVVGAKAITKQAFNK